MKYNVDTKVEHDSVYFAECEALVDIIVADVIKHGKLELGKYALTVPSGSVKVDETVGWVVDYSKSILVDKECPNRIKRILASQNGADWYQNDDLISILVMYKGVIGCC